MFKDDGRRRIAIGHLSDSGDLKKGEKHKKELLVFKIYNIKLH
jgi:hypothetical protein